MASLTVSTRSLRYPSAMAWRLRSTTARLNQQQCIHIYAKTSGASIALTRKKSAHSSPQIRKNKSAPLGARKRSSWSRGRLSIWDKRFSSFWHRPGCQWVNSDGDPRVTPRDKDCPACRDEQFNPVELAPRELLWQRKMHAIRNYFEKDPYDALFGASNDRLRGVFPRIWLDLDRVMRPHWMDSLRNQKHTSTNQQEAKSEKQKPTSDKPEPDPTPKQQATEESKDHAKLETKATVRESGPMYRHEIKQFVISQSNPSNETEPKIQGYGTWKVSGRDGQSSYEASGELEYDPITMRMVPKSSDKTQHTNNSTLAIEKAKETAVQIPVKKSPNSLASIPREQAAKTSVEVAKETSTESNLPDLRIANTLLSQNEEIQKTGREQTNIFDTFKPPQTKISNSIPEATPSSPKNKESIPAKTALEQSWIRENATRHMLRKEESTIGRTLSPFRPAVQSGKQANRYAPHLKDRPLKYMNAKELGNHRAALIEAWTKRHEKPPETAADRMLKEEVKKQKLAMHAMENKSRLRGGSTSTQSLPLADTMTKSIESLAGEGDVCPNAAKYTNSRMWYKKKAPHALVEEKHKMEDRALVRSIRKIYETSYGIIDTKHEQGALKPDSSVTTLNLASNEMEEKVPASSAPGVAESVKATAGQSTPAQPTTAQRPLSDPIKPSKAQNDISMYQILAYDPTDKSIYSAVASSSYTPPTGERIISVSDALIKLNYPAKFLPHLAKYQAGRYEVVSASKNLLVLKRTRQATTSLADSTSSSEGPSSNSMKNTKPRVNPIDGTGKESWIADLRPHTGNFASPTGFVNHDTFAETIDSTPLNRDSPPSLEHNVKVRRQEPVFSGQQKARNDHDSPYPPPGPDSSSKYMGYRKLRKRLREGRFKRLRRFFRRLLSVGLFTALCCYITGAVVESLREVNTRRIDAAAEKSAEMSNGETRRRWNSFSVRNEAQATGLGGLAGSSVASTNKQQQQQQQQQQQGGTAAGLDEEKAYAVAKAFVAGAVLLPVLKYIFRSGR